MFLYPYVVLGCVSHFFRTANEGTVVATLALLFGLLDFLIAFWHALLFKSSSNRSATQRKLAKGEENIWLPVRSSRVSLNFTGHLNSFLTSFPLRSLQLFKAHGCPTIAGSNPIWVISARGKYPYSVLNPSIGSTPTRLNRSPGLIRFSLLVVSSVDNLDSPPDGMDWQLPLCEYLSFVG